MRPDNWKEIVKRECYDGDVVYREIDTFEAGADAMHKADVEWLKRFRHDCIECGWTISPDHNDWRAFIEENDD